MVLDSLDDYFVVDKKQDSTFVTRIRAITKS